MVSVLGFSAPVNSSFIEQITYYPQRSILVVTIQTGIPYEYHNVPFQRVAGFLKSRSKGKYFNKFIKKNYSECSLLLLSS
jgi:hypothetical protein